MLNQQAILVFDGYCGFCTKSAESIKKLDKNNSLNVMPWQQSGTLELTGLTKDDVKTAAWLVIGDKRYRGAAAINAALSIVLKNSIFLSFYSLPVIKNIQDCVYKIVANNRFRFPGVKAYCKRPENHCEETASQSCKLPTR